MGSQTPDLDALSDLCTPWCIRVAVTLKVADRIAAGITSVADLAVATGSDPAALNSVLGHLAGKGIFAESAPGHFTLNDAANALREPARFLDLTGLGGRFARVWETLPSYVRTGKATYHEVFGQSYWEDLAAHPDIASEFDALMGMVGHGPPDPAFEIVGGWEDVRTVVDVGGGTGAMLAAILRLRPWIHGTLVDLPGTVARSAETFQAADVADRVTAVAQSFFHPLPAGADLYLLRKVLSDWPDHETVEILRGCAEAARPSGRVVVIGGVEPDGSGGQLTIEMLLVGGKTDSITRFGELAGEAGLEVVKAQRQTSGYFVVECRAA